MRRREGRGSGVKGWFRFVYCLVGIAGLGGGFSEAEIVFGGFYIVERILIDTVYLLFGHGNRTCCCLSTCYYWLKLKGGLCIANRLEERYSGCYVRSCPF